MNTPGADSGLSQAIDPPGRRGLLRVSERFVSRQGEGLLTGTESSFIRLSGCNLRCWFCDTPYASWEPDGQWVATEELVRWATDAGPAHVVLTGGEPLLPLQVVELCQAIRQAGLHLTIETAATVDRPVQCDLLSISPKTSGSAPSMERFADRDPRIGERWIEAHHRRRWQPQVIESLIGRAVDYQIKFVVDHEQETEEVKAAVDELGVPSENIWIMPQAATPDALAAQEGWVRQWCDTHGFHYCDRAHLRWYGAVRGT